MQLAELQSHFKNALLKSEDDAVAPALREDGLAKARRLDVYRNNVFSNLSDALASTFPAVEALVGEAFFRQMCRDYIRFAPPRVACLIYYGDDFAAFIRSYAPAASLPYLADMAAYEWAYNHAYYAADDQPFDPSVLETMDDEVADALVLGLRDSATVIASDFALDQIRRYTQHPDSEPPSMERTSFRLLLWRPEREIQWRELSDAEFASLQAIQNGKSLADVITVAMHHDPDMDAGVWLQTLFSLNVLRDHNNGGSDL